ncbi:MAG: hypothetical protein RIT45_2281 [Pseudomonadota bacterium]|jgi:hypothetical protein
MKATLRPIGALLGACCLLVAGIAAAQVPAAVPTPAADPAAVGAPALGPAAMPTPPADAAPKPAPVTVKAHVEPAEPVFGDRVELVVELRYPQDVRAFFPSRPALAPLLAIQGDPGRSDRREEPGDPPTIVETMRIPALVARSGLLRTRAIEIPWHRVAAGGGAGESGTVKVPALQIAVRSGLGDETAPTLAPLPPPLPLVEDNVPLRIGMLILAMLALGGALTMLALRLLRDRLSVREPEPQIPPHVMAFARLDDLSGSERIETEEPRLVYGELSEILRAYLGERYRFPALDMTSTELIESLSQQSIRGLTIAELQDFTAEGDLVKFARQAATPERLRDQLGWIRQVVQRTMQSAEELERERAQRIARLARQRKLRVQVMAPLELRVVAFAFDAMLGAVVTGLLAWLAIDTGQRSLFDGAYLLMLLWMAGRDLLGDGSPGKELFGLRIAEWDPNVEADPESVRYFETALDASIAARPAGAGQRLLRNLAFVLPGAGLILEIATLLQLPELRRFGDQIARTRVIDARFGLRTPKATWGSTIAMSLLAVVALLLPLLLGGRPS